ncbi:hypothetical protein EIP91_011876 [Steccherinum ochraceum]|uniref:Uncharacterized protein n=1 Tax=Steccherinum ochraceum TaxID=92696 RepID=A0A4R0RVJ6_9APHY|nr:hypothetical protein EIP91_011876 [Steccherinum ochraceum]
MTPTLEVSIRWCRDKQARVSEPRVGRRTPALPPSQGFFFYRKTLFFSCIDVSKSRDAPPGLRSSVAFSSSYSNSHFSGDADEKLGDFFSPTLFTFSRRA